MYALRFSFLFLAAQVCFHAAQSQSPTHRKQAWIAQYSLDRVLNSNGYTLITGDFLFQVSKYTGSGIPVDPINSSSDYSWPTINGTVQCAISDGQGGWYVGGNFNYADTVTVTNLVHIKSDKRVDRTWKPNPSHTVRAMAIHNGVLYVGGSFSKIANETRNFIAAFDTATGNLSTWNPNSGGSVYALEISGGLLYAGGTFTTMGGLSRTRVAAIDLTNGTPTDWAPVVNSSVYTLAPDAATNTIFIGGAFTSAGGSSRVGVARLATNTTEGLATAWVGDVNAGGFVRKLILHNSNLYVGGDFTMVAGLTRYGLGALDATKNTANGLNWNPVLEDGDEIKTMSVLGNTLYFAGYFDSVNGTFRAGAAAVNAADASLSAAWHPIANNDINIVTATNAGVFVGGAFNGINATDRTDVAVFLDETNEPLPVSLDLADGRIYSMIVSGTTMYFAGEFNSVNGFIRKNIAAVDLTTGTLLPWAPSVEGVSSTDLARVRSLEIHGNSLYVGGKFIKITNGAVSIVRPGLAALDLATGQPTSWNPTIGDGETTSEYVNDLHLSGNTLFVGGDFTTVNSANRSAAAAFDLSTGTLTSWAPEIPNGIVTKIETTGNTAYLLGDFRTTVGGAVRNYGIAALDLSTGLATSFNPPVNGEIYDIALSPELLFLAGDFTLIDSEPRQFIAAYNHHTGTLTSWESDIRQAGEAIPQVYSLAISPYRLYAGGWFEYLDYENRNNYAEYDLCLSSASITVTGTTLHAPAGETYQWYENDVLVDGATSQTYEINILEYGKYAVVVSSNGCTVRSNDYIYLVTGDEGTKERLAKVFPNPLKDALSIQVSTESSVSVFDITGKAVYSSHLISGENSVSSASWNPGAYVVKVSSSRGVETFKIIKTN